MAWNYSYNQTIWPSLFTVVLLITLFIFSLRRRSVPGALPFAIGCLFAALWVAGSVMEATAEDVQTKIFWFKSQNIFILPAATAITCFVLEYAWPGRWLTRRNLALLSIPCLVILGLVLMGDLHYVLWRGLEYDGWIIPLRTPTSWTFIAYGLALGILNLIVFAWLFLRSPQHRWPVVIMMLGLLAGRVQYMVATVHILPEALIINVPPVAFEYLMYAIALFGFRIFDPIPLARQVAIAQMREGMLVLDTEGKIVALNLAAVAILDAPARRLQGRPIQEVLPTRLNSEVGLQVVGSDRVEISLPPGRLDAAGKTSDTRIYQLEGTTLHDWRGLETGKLLMLHDITEQKHAQAQLLEQQRALAMLQEREQIARELHDSLGQVLGYVKIQAQAAREWLAKDKIDAADSSLAQLVAVAQDAHTDVREYILGTKTATSLQAGFQPALRQYLQNFSDLYLLNTELIVSPDWVEGTLEPTVEVQLLRIIQEALTNTRKHARAHCVQVAVQSATDRVQVTVQDDGVGFDPASPVNGGRHSYGLGFMRERAEEVHGSVDIYSAPGQGTRVVVKVPVRG